MPSSYKFTRCAIHKGTQVQEIPKNVRFVGSLNALYTHTKILNQLKAHTSCPNESCRRIVNPSVNPKSNKCPVTPCASSTCLNITMLAHVLHLFTKWPGHIFFESLFSPRQNGAHVVAATCYAKGQ